MDALINTFKTALTSALNPRRSPTSAASPTRRRHGRRLRPSAGTGARCAPQVRPAPAASTPDVEPLSTGRACGWFDSSHELQCGLQVTEHRGVEGLAADLPLALWLGLLSNTSPQPSDEDLPSLEAA